MNGEEEPGAFYVNATPDERLRAALYLLESVRDGGDVSAKEDELLSHAIDAVISVRETRFSG